MRSFTQVHEAWESHAVCSEVRQMISTNCYYIKKSLLIWVRFRLPAWRKRKPTSCEAFANKLPHRRLKKKNAARWFVDIGTRTSVILRDVIAADRWRQRLLSLIQPLTHNNALQWREDNGQIATDILFSPGGIFEVWYLSKNAAPVSKR